MFLKHSKISPLAPKTYTTVSPLTPESKALTSAIHHVHYSDRSLFYLHLPQVVLYLQFLMHNRITDAISDLTLPFAWGLKYTLQNLHREVVGPPNVHERSFIHWKSQWAAISRWQCVVKLASARGKPGWQTSLRNPPRPHLPSWGHSLWGAGGRTPPASPSKRSQPSAAKWRGKWKLLFDRWHGCCVSSESGSTIYKTEGIWFFTLHYCIVKNIFLLAMLEKLHVLGFT